MTARGRKPARAARPAPAPAEPAAPTADSTPAAGLVVALSGLALAGPGGPEQLRTGLRALSVRPKLLVGAAGDPAEQEADALADAVVHRMLQPEPSAGSPPEEEPPAARVLRALRRTPASRSAPATDPADRPAPGGGMGLAGGEVDAGTEQALRAAGTAGRPLAPALRRQYEDAFGADFSAVRVHSGPASAQLNAALGARAFTLGRDIYFGDRVPGTASTADRHLMAHELAHTLQDGDTGHRAVLRRLAVQITPSWEQYEAEPDTEHPTGLDWSSTDVEMPFTGEPDELHSPVPTHPVVEAKLDEDFDMLGTAATGTAPGTIMPGTPMQDTPRPGTPVLETLGLEPPVLEHPVLGHPVLAEEATSPRLELYIEAVAIVGRPARLFSGSMGDHMTAFVVSRKGVENAIVGEPFVDAVRELKVMAEELKLLPGWGLVDALKPAEAVPDTVDAPKPTEAAPDNVDAVMEEEKAPELPSGGPVVLTTTAEAPGAPGTPGPPLTGSATEREPEPEPGASAAKKGPRRRKSHHARFVEAQQHLAACEVLLDAAGTDDVRIVRLQDYIAAYLELRELVPLSVADWKGADRSRGGKGDGESGLHGFLADPEKEAPQAGQLRRDFLSSIATYRIAQAAVEPDADALAKLMPGLSPALSADERTELMATQHVQSVLTTFPMHFEALADDILQSEGQGRRRAAEKAERKKADLEASERRNKPKKGASAKSTGKRKAPVPTVLDDEIDLEERKEAEKPERTPEETFGIVRGHLTRLVRMRYAEAAATELAHQQKVAQLCAGEPQGELAEKYASHLTSFLTKSSGSSGSPGVKEKGIKRDRDSDPDVTDEVYGDLSAKEAKLVYTGRDVFKGTRKTTASGMELAVQVLLTDTGAVKRVLVERQGKYTKGAHTLPWIFWVASMGKDIKDLAPAAALATFTSKTVPAVRKILGLLAGAPATAPVLVPSTAMDLTEDVKEEAKEETKEEAKEEAKEETGAAAPDALPDQTVPLTALQREIADLLEEITDTPGSSVLDATDTGGKAESRVRARLAAYENGEQDLTADQLLRNILALCDVGEAPPELAATVIEAVLDIAKTDYPQAYAASGIADREVADLADLAALGKEGAYGSDAESESDEESESGSEPDEEKRPKKKVKKKPVDDR